MLQVANEEERKELKRFQDFIFNCVRICLCARMRMGCVCVYTWVEVPQRPERMSDLLALDFLLPGS